VLVLSRALVSWVCSSDLCVSSEGRGSFWLSAAPPFYLASLLFSVGGCELLDGGSSRNKVVAALFLVFSSPWTALELWFVSNLLRSAVFMAVVSLSSRRSVWRLLLFMFLRYVLCLFLLLVLCFVVDHRLVGLDLAFLQWSEFVNPKGYGVY